MICTEGGRQQQLGGSKTLWHTAFASLWAGSSMFNPIEIALYLKKLEAWDKDIGRHLNSFHIQVENHDLFFEVGAQQTKGITDSAEIRELDSLVLDSRLRQCLHYELIFTMGYEYVMVFYCIVENAFGSGHGLTKRIYENDSVIKPQFGKDLEELVALRHCIAHCNGYISTLGEQSKGVIKQAIEQQKSITVCSNDRIHLTKDYLESLGNSLKNFLIWSVTRGYIDDTPTEEFLSNQEKIAREIYSLRFGDERC